MQTLDNISSSQFANSVMSKIDSNFTKVRNAINALEQSGGGSSGGGETTNEPLKILCVGNSFTKNTMQYMANICSNLGVTNVTIQRLYKDGASLQQYDEMELTSEISDYAVFRVDVVGSSDKSSATTLGGLFAHPWDYVMFQQKSSISDDYSSYEPYLTNLINKVKANCTNPNVKFIWLMTWGTGSAAYSDIIAATKKISNRFDIVVPAGTAIQNIRNSSVNDSNAHNFSRDDQHLNMGVGDYVAGCTFYAAVLQPFTGKDVYNNNFSNTAGEHDSGTNGTVGAVDVTDANRDICKECAVFAVLRPYNPTDVENL